MSRALGEVIQLPSAKTLPRPSRICSLSSVGARIRQLPDRLAGYVSLQLDVRGVERSQRKPPSKHASPAAHRVPPELFQTIIREFNIQTGAHIPTATFSRSKKELKRHLGNVSLVCRYWAKNSRAAIFEELQLQNTEDAHQLLEFARTTTLDMSVGRFVREITLEATLPCTPWLHLVVHTLPRALFPNLERYTYGFGPGAHTADGWIAPRSVFAGLPRALPVPRLPVRPRLKWLDFAHLADLVAFVDSLFAARAHPPRGDAPFRFNTLSFYYVTWADNAEQVPAQVPQAFVGARRYWRKRVGDVHVVNCSAAWPLLWLLVRTERPRGPTPISIQDVRDMPILVDGMEMRRIAAIVHAIVESCKCAMCRNEASTRDVILRAPDMEKDTYVLEAQNRAAHKLVFKLALDGLVTQVQLNLIKNARALPRGKPPEELQFDFAALEQLLEAFAATLEKVCVQLPDVVFAAFEPHVRANMPVAEARGWLDIEKRSTTPRERWPEMEAAAR